MAFVNKRRKAGTRIHLEYMILQVLVAPKEPIIQWVRFVFFAFLSQAATNTLGFHRK